MSVRTSINRLLRLAALLRDLPKDEFDMVDWASDGVYGPCLLNAKPKCGMVCCIGGWATAIHPDLVLRYFASDENADLENKRTGSDGPDAFADAFGINLDTASSLLHWQAPHQTRAKAAAAVEKVASQLALENGYEIVEVDA